jgi:uncharacterized protein YkwD
MPTGGARESPTAAGGVPEPFLGPVAMAGRARVDQLSSTAPSWSSPRPDPSPMPILPVRRGCLPLLAAVLVLAAASTTAPPASAASHTSPDAVLRLLNVVRARHGVSPLREDPRLAQAARAHSRDMVAHRYFAHVSRSGERPSRRIADTGWMRGRRRWHVGENLAWGTRRNARPVAIVAAWLRSPAHRRIMLDPVYRFAGVGISSGTPFSGLRQGRTYTADFGG